MASVIFNGDFVKALKTKLKLGEDHHIISVSGVPTESSPDGSIALSDNGNVYSRVSGSWIVDNRFTDAYRALVDNSWQLGATNSPTAATSLGVSTDQDVFFKRAGFNYFKLGSAMTEFLQNVYMSAKRITGLADPIDAQDAATKNFLEVGSSTMTNKTINDVSNEVHSDASHYEIQAEEDLVRGDVIVATSLVGDTTVKVSKRSDLTTPVIGIMEEDVLTGNLGHAMSLGVMKNLPNPAGAWSVGDILYPDNAGGLTANITVNGTNYNQPIAYVIKANPTLVSVIVNVHSGHEHAELVGYDNTTSGMDATNVQAAIDEAATMGGVGSPSLYLFLDADSINVNDFTDTNNILSEDATETDNKRYLLTNTAGSTGYEASYTQVLQSDAKSRRTHICKIYNSDYTGTKGNVTLVIEDQLGNELKGSPIVIDPDLKYQQKIFSVPDTVTSIVVKPTIVTGEVATWTFDKIAFDYSPFGEASLEKKETITYTGFLSRNGLTQAKLSTVLTDQGNDLINDDNSGDFTKITFLKPCSFYAAGGGNSITSNTTQLQLRNSSGTLLLNTLQEGAGNNAPMVGYANAGDYLALVASTDLDNTASTNFSVTASATQDYVLVEDEREQAHFVGKAVYNLSSLYSTTSTSYVLPLLTLSGSSLSGDIEQNTANAPSITIPNAKVGTYLVTASNQFGASTSATFIKITDGTNDYSEQVIPYSGDGSVAFIVDNTTQGDLNLDLMLHVDTGTTYIYTAIPLELSVSYLPPASEKTVPTTYALPKSEVQDFDVDASSTGVLSNFNGASDWCSFVSKTTGNYTYTLNEDYFSEFPDLTAKILGGASIIAGITEGTFPQFTVTTFSSISGTFADYAHRIEAKKRGADRRDGEVFIADAPLVQHSNNEFWTGEYWIDGRKIYGRSFEITSNITSTTTIATIDTGLSLCNGHKFLATKWLISSFALYTVSGSDMAIARYDDSTGVVDIYIAGRTVYAGTKVTIKYIK